MKWCTVEFYRKIEDSIRLVKWKELYADCSGIIRKVGESRKVKTQCRKTLRLENIFVLQIIAFLLFSIQCFKDLPDCCLYFCPQHWLAFCTPSAILWKFFVSPIFCFIFLQGFYLAFLGLLVTFTAPLQSSLCLFYQHFWIALSLLAKIVITKST